MSKKIENHTAGLILFIVAYISGVTTLLASRDDTSELLAGFGLTSVIVIAFMTVLFVVSRLLGRTDVIDAAWGPAFIVAAVASFVIGEQTIGLNLQTLLLVLVTIWGARLSYSITRRLITHDEDPRYVELRKKWKGNEALNTYLRIFLLQGVLASVVSIAVIYANLAGTTTELSAFVYAGLIIWLIGFFFEVVGDVQLKAFLLDKKNKGSLMTKGLWAYTRHPNYFGEAAMWWGVFVIALGVPYGVVGIITPVIITYLLYFISGVPMTEKSFSKKKGWKTYKENVSKFFPLPPKREE